MARIARIVLPRTPHLIAQRGNRSERLFYSAADRKRYLQLVSESLADHAVRLWAYRLDADQVHLVVCPRDGDALAVALRNAHGRYSQSINRRQSTTGHLFQGRFYSCPLDQAYLALAVRRLERFEGDCPSATVSSTALRLGGEAVDWPAAKALLADGLPLLDSVKDWRAWLAGPIDKPGLAHLQSRLRVGKPAGSAEFVRRAERLTGLNLSRPRGRPPKTKPGRK